jgi:hypothetical protein
MNQSRYKADMSVALLADMMTGAIPSTFPLGVLIVTFCKPRTYLSFGGIYAYPLKRQKIHDAV